MKLSDQATVVPGLGDQLRDHGRMIGKRFIPVASVVNTRRIHPRHEARTTRSADRALAIGMCEGNALGDQAIDRGRDDMRVTERPDRVEPLLIGTVPEDVGTTVHKSHYTGLSGPLPTYSRGADTHTAESISFIPCH